MQKELTDFMDAHSSFRPNASPCLEDQRLGIALSDGIVVGDSVWDLLGARRAKALGIGLLCGGYGPSQRPWHPGVFASEQLNLPAGTGPSFSFAGSE